MKGFLRKLFFLATIVVISACHSQSFDGSTDTARLIDAETAAKFMQTYCVNGFPNESALKNRLVTSGFKPIKGEKTWRHPSYASSVNAMESPTGRGFGCSVTFYSSDAPREVSDAMQEIVEIGNLGVFSVWYVSKNNNTPTIIPIFNYGKTAPLEIIKSIPSSNNYQYVTLLTEK